MNNNRTTKNIILLVIMLLAILAMFFTIKNTVNNNTIVNKTEEKTPVNRPTPPEKPSESMGEPPEKPSEGIGEPPEKPKESTDTNTNPVEDKAPSMGSDALDETTTSEITKEEKKEETLEEKKVEDKEKEKVTVILPSSFYMIFSLEALVFSICLVYLVESRMNKKDFQDTFLDWDKISIFVLSTIILTSIIVLGGSKLATKITPKIKEEIVIEDKTQPETEEKEIPSSKPNNTEEIEAKGGTIIIDDKEITGNYESKNIDESVILIKDGGNATLKDVTLSKSGDSSNNENSDFYGINSGILVKKDSTATIKNTSIITSSKGSNAIFSTGENSKIYISDSTIETTGTNSARGLDATYGGYIEADNVTITTLGGSCAALATDRGEGTVKANNSKLTTNGKGSPLIYSTGDISIDNSEGSANDSQIVVVEGKNSATVSNSSLIAAGTGNRSNIDKAGVMIYQSMSGDAKEGKGIFTSNNSTLTISDKSDVYKTAPMFFVTNTTAEINLNNTKLNYGSNILLSIAGTNEWGKSGSNGGNVTLNTNNQTMSGKIIVDNISTLTINLVKTSYKGSINSTNTAKKINIKLDKDSKITLTADTYITSLENEDSTNNNIAFNNHSLYVNGVAISQK